MSFRGSPYRLAALDRIPQDPSWYSHIDESGVRDRDWLVSPGDVVLDVGSAFGSYALTALAVGASFVHCWNPRSEENEVLQQSLELNGWSGRCAIHEVGLWSRSGWLSDELQSFREEQTEKHFRVEALDEQDVDLPKGHLWVKIDVEGAEVEVLRGAKNLLTRRNATVLVENHQFIDQSIQGRVEEAMREVGYEMAACHPYNSVSHSVFRRTNPGADI